MVDERKAIGRLLRKRIFIERIQRMKEFNLVSQTSLLASNRISIQLFSKANNGARGKAATKIVMKPNCSTKFWRIKFRHQMFILLYPFLDILQINQQNHYV